MTELSRQIDLPRWRQRRRKSISGFRFGNVSHLKTPKAICITNLPQIAQSAGEVLIFPVSENKRPSYWNSTPDSILTFPFSSASNFASAQQISSKSDHRRPSYDVIAIFKMAATASQIYFRIPLWWRIAIKNVKIYLHTKFRQRPRSRYYYFRILRLHTKFHPNRNIGGRIMTF